MAMTVTFCSAKVSKVST